MARGSKLHHHVLFRQEPILIMNYFNALVSQFVFILCVSLFMLFNLTNPKKAMVNSKHYGASY